MKETPFLLICAYRAGYSMYKNDFTGLCWYSNEIIIEDLHDRTVQEVEDTCEPYHECGTFGTHEYGFTLDGEGIDCGDELIREVATEDTFYSYHPSVGVSIITGCKETI